MLIFTPLVSLLNFLGTPAFLIGFVTLWSFWCGMSILDVAKPVSRERVRIQLLSKTPAKTYRATLRPGLEALGRWLTPQTVEDHPQPEKWWHDIGWFFTPRAPTHDVARATGDNPFSWRVFDAALLVAVAYPLTMLLGQWAASKSGAGIGDVILIPAVESGILRFATIGGMVFMVFAMFMRSRAVTKGHKKREFWWLIVAFAVAVLVGVAGLVEGALALAIWVAGPFAFSGAVAGAFPGVGVVAFAVAVAVAVAVTSTVAGAVTNTVAGAVTSTVAVASIVAGVFAGILGTFSLFAGRIRHGAGAGAYLAFVLILLAFLIGLSALPAFTTLPVVAKTLFLFMGVLPLVNAMFDFASYGITLTLIKSGLTSGTVKAALLGIADAFIALALFTFLGITLLLVTGVIQWLSGSALLPLDALFSDLRDPATRWNHAWLFAMMFSTALPTLAHFCLAMLSFLGFFPYKWRNKMAGLQDHIKPDNTAWFKYHLAVSLMRTLSLVIPLVLLCGLVWSLWNHAGWLGTGYLQFFEFFARITGQIPAIGPGPFTGDWA